MTVRRFTILVEQVGRISAASSADYAEQVTVPTPPNLGSAADGAALIRPTSEVGLQFSRPKPDILLTTLLSRSADWV